MATCGNCNKDIGERTDHYCQEPQDKASSGNSDLLLADRLEEGIASMEGLIEYVNDFGADIDPKVVKSEAGEAILRMKGTYGQ